VNIESRSLNSIQIAEVSGRIDPANTAYFENEINKIINGSGPKLLLNMKEVVYISSSGLRVFLTLLKKMRAANGELKICCMSPNIQKIFQISGFVQLFDIHGTEEEALQKFQV